jgi:hypothetical protein
MTEKQDFPTHLGEQLKRLEIFTGWRVMESSGRREYRRWIEQRAGSSGAKVEEFLNELVTLEEFPSLAEMQRIWLRMWPPQATASRDCPHCRGLGYEIVERADGTSGALRCRCGGSVPGVGAGAGVAA